MFTGTVSNYGFSFAASSSVFTDLRSGSPDGADSLATIERVQFSNATNSLIAGTDAVNVLVGTSSTTIVDLMLGFAGNDSISAGAGSDFIVGGSGADTLAGGTGADTFVFQAASESGVTAGVRDVITDFTTTAQSASAHDVIDLSRIDASAALEGRQAFNWGGTTATAGGVWYQQSGSGTSAITMVSGDITGDAVADFQIQLAQLKVLAASDFLL